MFDLAIRTTRFHRLLKRVQKHWMRYVERKALDRFSTMAYQLWPTLTRDGQIDAGSAAPQVVHALRTRSDVIVLFMSDAPSGDITKVLKLPLTTGAEHSLAYHRQVIMTLRQVPALDVFCALIPEPLTWGEYDGRPYYLETALSGVAAADLVRRRREPPTLVPDAARLIQSLHCATMRRQRVDEMVFARLAGNDLALLRQLAEGWPDGPALARRLEDIGDLLRGGLVGRELPFSWTHGDYWPGNILVRQDTQALGGIVDWDRAAAQQLPLLDILHLLAYTRKMRRRTELGEEVVEYLLPAAFSAEERAIVDEALARLDLPQSVDFLATAAWLYWLRFAAANLSRYPAFQHNREWMRDNILLVLKRGVS